MCDYHIEAGLERDSVGWGIQISVLEARLMSILLFREDLYVAVCQDRLQFPQNIKELPELIHTLKGLQYLVERNKNDAIKLIGLYDKIYRSYTLSLNNDPINSTSTCHSSYNSNMTTLPTYYTSLLGDRTKSVIPSPLFYKGKRRLFQERIIIGENSSEAVILEMKGTEDMFGWIKMDDDT